MAARFNPHEYSVELAKTGDYAAEGGVLYRWTGTHWSACDEGAACQDAYRWISETNPLHTSAENAVKAVRSAKLWVKELPLVSDEIIIPCSNGYVRLVNGQLTLIEPAKEFGMQHALRCAYEPEFALATRFENFLRTVLPDEAVRGRVQEYVGYTLMSDARYQRAQLWLGAGANGKGVLANIVQELHGNTAAVSLDGLEGFKLSVLVGASLIFVDEIPKNRINEQILKSLIAGERIQIDRKYEKPISIHVRGKWLVLGNHLPTVTDHSIGFWRRWDIVPFNVTVKEADRDPLLAQTIIDVEMPGVLNWALAGLARLQKRSAFEAILPVAMQDFLSDAKRETNSVQGWYEESDVIVMDAASTPKDEVYEHYREWCGRNGIPPMGSPRFWSIARDIGPYGEARIRQGAIQVRVCNLHVPGCSAAQPPYSQVLRSVGASTPE